MNGPLSFGEQQFLNHFNMQPSCVRGTSNASTHMHKRYLYTKLYYVFKFTIPKNWPINWFRFWLFQFGSIAVLYTREFGWVAMPYGITGLDLYYQPSTIQVSNHLFNAVKQGKIGVNAEIIYLMDDYYSLDDLVTKYAEELAQVDRDFNINLMNANLSLMAEVENDKQATEIKEAYGEATTGKPLTVINKKILQGKSLSTLIQAPKQSYIGDQLLAARRNIVNQFLTDIGIPNYNMDKKAQQNNLEITENDDETRAICTVIEENVNECFERLNRISGLECRVQLRPQYRKEAMTNGTNNALRNVSI